MSVTCGRSVVFSGSGTQVSSTNKTDSHNITEILLKVVLNTITPTPNLYNHVYLIYLVDSQQQTNAHTSKSGRPNSIFLSNLPGLIKAGSKVSGLLVAMRTFMLPRGSKPSSWLINSNIVLWTSLSPPAPSSNLAPVKKIKGHNSG